MNFQPMPVGRFHSGTSRVARQHGTTNARIYSTLSTPII
jgi:hypothetical protein